MFLLKKRYLVLGWSFLHHPQSLINVAGNFGGDRYLNPTAPFMSLESLTVDVVGLGEDIFGQ